MTTKKIFLASSSELKEDRAQFEIFINRKNKDWNAKGVFLDLVMWEDFLDAMSQTRLQGEYNKAIRDCDIFVMLFWTKVGQYTGEEFEAAFGQFKATSKPIMFTYFKQAEIIVDRDKQNDLMSLFAFQEKLNALGHFSTVYRNVDELKFKFNQQLDKLASDLGLSDPSARSRADLGIARTFQARTRAFTDEYLFSETGPVPFGGRDDELRVLDEWLENPQSPSRMLITAPAGRGKSALLVRWMKNLQDRGVCAADGWRLVFMPISIRIGTNRPEVFYEGLARRLSEITAEPLENDAFRDSNGFRYAVRDQLDRLTSNGEPRTLIVIDGVDEALEGSFDPAVLPTPLPNNIRVLLSARWQVGDQNSKGWLDRLGWDRSVKIDAFELDRLHAKQIADVLLKLGAPIDVFTRQPGLVERLAELTGGEPLLVRYYSEDLWSHSSKGARISPSDLDLLKPGFDSYFKRWFELQERLWKEEGDRFNLVQVDGVLSVLAFALGPLPQADLLPLMEYIHGVRGLVAVDRLLEPLRRWVFGSGQSNVGYVLTHPKVGEYLQRSRFATSATRIKQGFADWCKTHCIALNEGRLTPEQASPYCLQFLPEHLKQVAAPPEELMLMMENGWRRAWEKFEGGQRGFASAVQTAFTALNEGKPHLRLGARWRCALTLSSIRSLGENMPVELALCAVKLGVLSVRQAAHFASLKESSEGALLLSKLSALAQDNAQLQSELAASSLAAANAIPPHYLRSELWEELAQNLPSNVQVEVLESANNIANEESRGYVLAKLIPHLPSHLITQGLTAVKLISDNLVRTRTLAALASYLPPEEGQSAADEALANATAICNEKERTDALVALIPYLSGELYESALRRVKSAVDERTRAFGLAGILEQLPVQDQNETVAELLATAWTFSSDTSQYMLLLYIAPHLSPGLVDEALGIADTVNSREYALAQILVELPAILQAKPRPSRFQKSQNTSPALPPEKQQAIDTPLSITVALTCTDDFSRLSTIVILLPRLSPEQKEVTLDYALAQVEAMKWQVARPYALAALASTLSSEQAIIVLRKALEATSAIAEDQLRSSALATLAPILPPELHAEGLALVKAIPTYNIPTVLNALAPTLSAALLADAIGMVRFIGGEYCRSTVLATLASHLPLNERLEVIREAFDTAKAARDNSALALAKLISLHPGLKEEAVADALAALRSCKPLYTRATVLHILAPHLHDSVKQQELRDVVSEALAHRKGREICSAVGLLAQELTEEFTEGERERERVYSKHF
jgi:hypothetical protein